MFALSTTVRRQIVMISLHDGKKIMLIGRDFFPSDHIMIKAIEEKVFSKKQAQFIIDLYGLMEKNQTI